MKKDTTTSRLRRSLLYIPGNNPGMMQNCAIYGADGVLLDLEDAISMTEKDSARKLVKHALMSVDMGRVERVVRINGRDTRYFENDLAEIIPAHPDAIRLPKVDSADDVIAADHLISQIESRCGIAPGTVRIQAMLETARAIVNAASIAASSPRLIGLTLGGQDLAADLGIRLTKEGFELLYAKSAVVIAAKAFGLLAFDTVYTNVNDLEGLRESADAAVTLGFSGKAAIHPSQIPVIHAAFTPDAKALKKAIAVVSAAREAEKNGVGVIALNGHMIDGPVIAQSEHIIDLAVSAGMEVPEL